MANGRREPGRLWFADREIPILTYKVNRRPRPQGNLFADQPDRFLDHLVEALVFGDEVATRGRGSERFWRLGNRDINETRGYVAGRIGYRTADQEEEDHYDSEAAEWRSDVVPTERRAFAPFVLTRDERYLCVAKHPTFYEGALPTVFEAILNRGEDARQAPTTEWSVEPELDQVEFEKWLRGVSVLDKVNFHVKLPNPDAAESFAELDAHLRQMEASELRHSLKPRDPDRGLSKDFTKDSISQGLLEMARRAYATVRAVARDAGAQRRVFNQRQHVRHESVQMPSTDAEADQAIIEYGLGQEG